MIYLRDISIFKCKKWDPLLFSIYLIAFFLLDRLTPLLLKVVWYKDTMKLMESSHLHILTVGDTHKLNILGIKDSHLKMNAKS